MSDFSDTSQSKGAYPLPERVRFAQWFQRFPDRDRSADYRGALWDLLRALPTLPADYEKQPFVLRYREDRSILRFSLLGRLFLRFCGRSDEEPGEHVFSFDRKLRAGHWLRNRGLLDR